MSGLPIGTAIEAESFRILAERIDLSGLDPLSRAVVARVIHASADIDYARDLVVDDDDVAAGVAALRRGAPVVTDVEMVRHAVSSALNVSGVDAHCYLATGPSVSGLTRSAAGMREAARHHPHGAVVVVGCAPTALEELIRLHRDEGFTPALVIGMPVGFVGAAESKERLRRSGMSAISNRGEKGGSAVAAAALNAIAKLSREEP